MTIIEIDMGATTHSNGGICYFSACSPVLLCAASDRTYLATAKYTATQVSTIHINIGSINIAVGNVSTAEGVACSCDGVCCCRLTLTWVINLFYIAFIDRG